MVNFYNMINRIKHMPPPLPHLMQSMLHVVQVPPDWNGTIKGLSVGARSLVTWTNTKKNVV